MRERPIQNFARTRVIWWKNGLPVTSRRRPATQSGSTISAIPRCCGDAAPGPPARIQRGVIGDHSGIGIPVFPDSRLNGREDVPSTSDTFAPTGTRAIVVDTAEWW